MRAPLDLVAYVDLDDGDERQVFLPQVTADYEPRLQAGESIVARFDTVGVGIRLGGPSSLFGDAPIEELAGRCHLTTTRAVFVCRRWWPGEEVRSTTVRLLVGQVRWPWLTTLTCSRSLIEFRCVQPVAGTRGTSNFLSMVPHPDVDVAEMARLIVDSVRDDRLGHPGLSDERAAALRQVDVGAVTAGRTTIKLPGAYKRLASTAMYGGRSATSLAPWRDRMVDLL